MPIVILPFIVNFPGAILWYWTCTNFISLGQVAFLKIPKVRNYFNIEPLVIHAPTSLPMKSEGFAKGFRDSWTNVKISRQLEERAYADKIRLERASRPAIEKNAQESVADSTTHSTNSFSNKR
uniref:Putative secreted protein n=1 Tax=Xenopsylla cheopis TaxID=163159 RepID=A0A6M2E060_XENCH